MSLLLLTTVAAIALALGTLTLRWLVKVAERHGWRHAEDELTSAVVHPGDDEAFERIRRNVLISSSILCLFFLSEADFDAMVTYPPLALKLAKPERIIWFLVAAHCYFFVRFLVHSRVRRQTIALNLRRAFRVRPYFKELVRARGGRGDVNINGDGQRPWMYRDLFARRMTYFSADGDATEDSVGWCSVFIPELVSDITALVDGQIGIEILVPCIAAWMPVVAFLIAKWN